MEEFPARLLSYSDGAEKVASTFQGFKDSDQADREYYARLTPEERVEIVTQHEENATPMRISKDFKEFIELLNSNGSDYLIASAAMPCAWHGHPQIGRHDIQAYSCNRLPARFRRIASIF